MINPKFKENLEIFEEKYGIKAYQELVQIFNDEIKDRTDLIKSRDNWRKKYEELKKGNLS